MRSTPMLNTNEPITMEKKIEQRSKEELEKIVADQERYEYYAEKFSLKWVEKVVFWVIIAFATAVIGVIITNVLSSYLHKIN